MTDTRRAHPGAICSPVGAVGVTKAGTTMVCRVNTDNPPKDGRARWGRRDPVVKTGRRRGAPRKRQGLEKRYVDQLTLDVEAPLPQRLLDQLDDKQTGALRRAGGLAWRGPRARKADIDKLTRAGLLTDDGKLTTRGAEALRKLGELGENDCSDEERAAFEATTDRPAPAPIVKGKPEDRSGYAGTDWSRYEDCPACEAPASFPCFDLSDKTGNTLNATAHADRPFVPGRELPAEPAPKLLDQPKLLDLGNLHREPGTITDQYGRVWTRYDSDGMYQHDCLVHPAESIPRLNLPSPALADNPGYAGKLCSICTSQWPKADAPADQPDDTPRTVDQARQDIEDLARMSPGTRRNMLRSLADGHRDNPEVADMYRSAAADAGREADHGLAQGFVDNVHSAEKPKETVQNQPSLDPAAAYEQAQSLPSRDIPDGMLAAALHHPADGHSRNKIVDEAVRRATPADPTVTPVAGHRSTRPELPNYWGTSDGEINYHGDGITGRGLDEMGADRLMDVDGEPLANVAGRIATGVVRCAITPEQAFEQMRQLRDRTPAGSAARRGMDTIVTGMGCPQTPPPVLPDAVPEPLRRLAADLHAQFPLVRRDGGETGRLAGLARDWLAGDRRSTGLGLVQRLRYEVDSAHHESDSDRGHIAIRRRVAQAARELDELRKTDRTVLYPPRTDAA